MKSTAESLVTATERSTERTEAPAIRVIPHGQFRISLRNDDSARYWALTAPQVAAIIRAVEAGLSIFSKGPTLLAAERGLLSLRGAYRFADPPSESERDVRLRRIADDLDAYARDEGGFSDETRRAIADDARFLREDA